MRPDTLSYMQPCNDMESALTLYKGTTALLVRSKFEPFCRDTIVLSCGDTYISSHNKNTIKQTTLTVGS